MIFSPLCRRWAVSEEEKAHPAGDLFLERGCGRIILGMSRARCWIAARQAKDVRCLRCDEPMSNEHQKAAERSWEHATFSAASRKA